MAHSGPILATLVTGEKAANELRVFLKSVELFEPHARVFILTDAITAPHLHKPKSLTVKIQVALKKYANLTRSDMEALPGKTYDSLFKDYTMEKATAIEGAFSAWPTESATTGIWFLDSDITLFAPLPSVSAPYTLAVSPHYIRAVDESKYGRFNAGMIWFKDTSLLPVWRGATHQSRFFEQAALEVLAEQTGDRCLELPIQDNFGWWRYLQSSIAPPEIEKNLGFHRFPGCAGLKYNGVPLRSVHTHWHESTAFNNWILNSLKRVAPTHPPARELMNSILASVRSSTALNRIKG